MIEPHVNKPPDELIVRYLEGVADAGELAALNAQLAEDVAARSRFVEVALHERCLAELLPAERVEVQDSQFGVLGKKVRSLEFAVRSWIALAALVVLAVTAWFVLPLDSSTPHSALRTPQFQSVALVTNLNHAIFDGADESMKLGAELNPGTLKLESGTAQLMFKSGAVVDLTGPCEFTMIGPNRGALKRGTLSAYVEQRARGFTVEGPHGVRAVDLGTQFVMSVSDLGVTTVNTLAGHVRLERDGAGSLELPAGLAGAADSTGLGLIAFDLEAAPAVRQQVLIDENFTRDSIALIDRFIPLQSNSERWRRVTGSVIGPEGGAIQLTTQTAYQRFSGQFDPIELNMIGATLRARMHLWIDPSTLSTLEPQTMGFRFGFYDSADTMRQNDDRGYRMDLRFDDGEIQPGAFLRREPPGDSPLGGSVFGHTLGKDARVAIVDGRPHSLVIQLQRTPDGVRTLGLIDDRIVLDYTDGLDVAYTRFDRVMFGTGQVAGTFVIDDVSVSVQQPNDSTASDTSKPH